MYKILFFTYQFFRAIRYALILGMFGTVSKCKHSPTCGTYFFKVVKERGLLKGLPLGIVRVANCW